MTEKIDKKNDSLFPFQTYTFRNTSELETMCPNAFDMMLNPEHEHELWIGNINGLVSPTSEYGLAIKLKGYIIAGKKLTFILPENYEAIRPDNGNIGFRKTVLDMIRLGESKGLITIYTYSIEYAEDDINKKILNEFKETDMKFDVAIMNPPYDRNLHLKILENVIPIANKVVNISPVSQLVNCVNTFKDGRNDTKKYFTGIGKHLKSCGKIFSIEEALQIFTGARITNPLAIQVYEISYNSIEECERVNSHNGMKTIVKKVYDYSHDVDNIENHLESNKKDGYRIKFGRIGGGTWTAFRPHTLDAFKEVIYDGLLADGRPHWQMCSVNQYTKKTEELPESLPFATKAEAQNFIDSYNTKFLKTCLGFLHVDMHIHPEYLPYMQDYTQPWDDKRFCEYFRITGYIDDDHAEPGSEWETILKTMEQYK